MKFGYMAGFRGDLASEIDFAKTYFDFIEITIQPSLLEKFEALIPGLKEKIGKTEILGHIHDGVLALDAIKKNIELLAQLGIQKITIHPFEKLGIPENIELLKKVAEFCATKNIQLCLENISKPPYNSVENIKAILEQLPDVKLTLDVGHANRAGELDKFLEVFKGKIGHIHLHDNMGQMDHLFFTDKNKFDQAISKIKATGYDGTVLMETFAVMDGDKSVSLDNFEDIKGEHIKQNSCIIGS